MLNIHISAGKDHVSIKSEDFHFSLMRKMYLTGDGEGIQVDDDVERQGSKLAQEKKRTLRISKIAWGNGAFCEQATRREMGVNQ